MKLKQQIIGVYKERVNNFRLPIFDACNVWLIVSSDVGRSRSLRDAILGQSDGVNYTGLHAWDNKGKFFIFLRSDSIDHALIAHEIFHATHRMLEYCCHDYSPNGHEPHAHLCGYLTRIVYARLKAWRVPIMLHWEDKPSRKKTHRRKRKTTK